jgi:hypothetical protein
MEKITYLLGAGASAGVLPLIRENKESGNSGLANALENFVTGRKYLVTTNSSEEAFQKLVTIVKKCKAFGTPDLAAKNYLEVQDMESYRMLKLLISSYFHSIEEEPDARGVGFEGQNLDSRVVPFLTTISHKGKLPPTMKILSWNYDTQLERGAKKLHPLTAGVNNDFSDNFHVWPFQVTDRDSFDKDYFLLHLNGICGFLYSEPELAVGNPYPMGFNRPMETLLSFAWEDDNSFNKKTFTDKRVDLAKQMMDKTTILVVIGYSFPFFNRKIDAELFNAMKKTLKKIYFQDPKLDGQFLYSQFGLHKTVTPNQMSMGLRVTEIEHIEDKSQYYVPFEL